jgi:hypothetical protein
MLTTGPLLPLVSCLSSSVLVPSVSRRSKFSSRTVQAIAAFAMLFVATSGGAQVTQLPGSTAVGQQASATVTVTMAMSGSASSIQAVMQGVPNLDFSVAAGGTCATGTGYIIGQQCTVNIAFAPRYPGARAGAVVIENAGGTVLGTALIAGNATGSLAVLAPANINTVAGDSAWNYTGDGVPATGAPIFLPTGVFADSAGNIYLTDSNNNRIRRVDAKSGLISTVAGNGSPGYGGDGGPATQAQINTAANLVLDGAGNIYFADTGNHIIRRIDFYSGIMTTVAGTPTIQGYSGDGGAATAATLSQPEGLAFDAAGDLYIADSGNNVIREIDAVTGKIRTIVGTGYAAYSGDGGPASSAKLNSPWNLTVGPDNSLYIADFSNHCIRKVSASGTISTIAGTGSRGYNGDGNVATQSQLDEPAGVVLDPAGNIYIADAGNNRVREISVATNIIRTIAGSGSEEFSGDGGDATGAGMYGPYALNFDQSGDLLIADLFHNRIRVVGGALIALQYPVMRVNTVSVPQAQGLANDGNSPLNFSSFTLNSAALDPATTTCAAGTAVASGTSCNLGVEFTPAVVGKLETGSVLVNSDSGNSPNVIDISGQVLNVNPTTVALTSSANPSALGASVVFTATVSGGSTAATGTVVFFDGQNQICSVSLNSNSIALCSTSSLILGQHSITASYSGDGNNEANTSPVLTQVVKLAVTLTLSVSPNPSVVSNPVVLSATATSTGTPTGMVTYYDGTTVLGTAYVTGSGVATFTTYQLTVGTHNLSAQYAGDPSNEGATSNVVSDIVQQATSLTTLASSNSTTTVGLPVTFTATVVSLNGPAPTGSVQFTDGATVLGTVNLTNSGTAALVLSNLAPGSHKVVATYSGDTNNGTSVSSTLTETILQIGTTITATSSANPVSAGGALQLTAYVVMAQGATADGPITGTVGFTDGSYAVGYAAVDNTGHATISVNTLSVGTHAIVATYAGNTNYASSTSAALSQAVQSTPTTTTISSSASSTLAGKPVTFTITVTSSTAIPTGSVVILNGAATLGQATLNAQGVATFVTSSLSVGTHTISASYGGDSNYLASTSTGIQQIVSLAATTLTLAGPTAPINAGVSFTATATLSTTGVAPTGALTLLDGSNSIGTLTVTAAGSFAFTNSTLSVGTHTLTASYAGDSNNAPATSGPITVIVQLAPTVTSLISSANPGTVGQPLTLTSSVTSVSPNATGTISFEDGGVIIGSAPLVSGTATFATSSLSFGAHSLTAVYSGDAIHAASTSALVTEQIVQGATAALSSSVNPSVSGQNVVFTAKLAGVGSVVPTGNVILSDGAATLATITLDATGTATYATSTLAVGSHIVTLTYAGDKNYAAASATLTQTVQNASTQMSLTATSNPATYGTPLGLSATVTSNGSVATGSVSFTDGTNSLGSAVLNAAGVATLTVSTLPPGPHSIVANYAGDGKAAASSSTPLALSVEQPTTLALSSNANPAQTLTPVIFTVTITNSGVTQPTGVVTFTDGTTLLGTGTVDTTGHATISVPSLVAGNHSVVASYAGDVYDFASTSPALAEIVQLRPTTTAVTAMANNPADPLQVTLIAIVRWTGTPTPTGTVVFTTGTTTIGSTQVDATGLANLTIDLPSSNAASVTAAYSGDTVYAASTSQATAITGGVTSQFMLGLTPSSVTIPSTDHTTVGLTLTSVKGFTDTLEFGCLGLPFAATCTFSSDTAALAANGSMAMQLTIDTGNPLGAGAQARVRTPQTSSAASTALLCFLPGSVLAGLFFFRGRRRSVRALRSWAGLLLLLAAIAATVGMSGCAGGLQINGTPAGTYTFKVTASGQGTGLTESQTMTLIVK